MALDRNTGVWFAMLLPVAALALPLDAAPVDCGRLLSPGQVAAVCGSTPELVKSQAPTRIDGQSDKCRVQYAAGQAQGGLALDIRQGNAAELREAIGREFARKREKQASSATLNQVEALRKLPSINDNAFTYTSRNTAIKSSVQSLEFVHGDYWVSLRGEVGALSGNGVLCSAADLERLAKALAASLP